MRGSFSQSAFQLNDSVPAPDTVISIHVDSSHAIAPLRAEEPPTAVASSTGVQSASPPVVTACAAPSSTPASVSTTGSVFVIVTVVKSLLTSPATANAQISVVSAIVNGPEYLYLFDGRGVEPSVE